MATVVKTVLSPGCFSIPDGQGGRVEKEFTEDDIRHLYRRAKAMLAVEKPISVPGAWEHQRAAKPGAKPATADERLAAKAKFCWGFADRWGLKRNADGELELVAIMAVDDPKEARQLKKVRYVSPEIIENWKDGLGRVWKGPSITHLAATPRPVMPGQDPFEVRMSLEPGALWLSLDDRVGPITRTRGTKMKSRLGFKGEDFAGRRRGTDDPTLRDRAWTGERLSEDNDEGGDMDQLLRLLAAKGITLPEDTTEPDLVYHLFCATTALYKGREAAAEEDDETGDQDDAQDSFEDDEDEDTYAGHPGYSLSLTTPDEGQQALIARFSSPGSGSRETSQTLIDRLSR